MKKWRFAAFILCLLMVFQSRADNHNTYPLPEDRGTAGTLAALEKLPVYVRILQIIAHPDDESAGTLTWLARKAHTRTALFSFTRGDGGQNILGNEKYEAMGLLRTGELLEACKYYGVELYFGSAFEFGFSKSGEETLSKWGHDPTLEELVRFIRTWKPIIIISRFQGTAADGHGHHQAAGILAKEAFRAAGDPARFPDQIKQGLSPWQAKSLFCSAMGGMEGSRGSGPPQQDAASIVRIPVGDYDPVLGRSYREIGSEGYSKHRSQGNGMGFALPGRSYESFRLMDSTIGNQSQGGGFFSGIDTSLEGILDLADSEKAAIPFLRADLAAAAKAGNEALDNYQAGRTRESAEAVRRGAEVLTQSLRKLASSPLGKIHKDLLSDAVQEKLEDFQKAIGAVLGIELLARADAATATPGQTVELTTYFFNRGAEEVELKRMELLPERGYKLSSQENLPYGKVSAGESRISKSAVSISQDAKVTEPFWYRKNSTDNRYTFRPTSNIFAPFEKSVIEVRAIYSYQGTEVPIIEPALAQGGDALRGSNFIEFQIVPAVSIKLLPGSMIAPVSKKPQTRRFQVSVLNNETSGIQGNARLVIPSGWSAAPAEAQFSLSRKREIRNMTFLVTIPGGTPAGIFSVDAVAETNRGEFRRGYNVVSYPENWTRNIYTQSSAKLEVFDIKVASDVIVGYIMGSGDEVPQALEQLGAKVQLLTGDELSFGDLNHFSAIITGVRAYNVNEDLQTNNQRLLQYAEQGGLLIVQYNQPLRGGPGPAAAPGFPYGPYPMTISANDRITVEESPLTILEPSNPVFTTPNKITDADFTGWVQERGLYFMGSWDSRYTPLLSGHDPGEDPKNGGMLWTRYGKGYYIFTAYAWFRQLPAGVPGAFRIFANLLSLRKYSSGSDHYK
jgi:LmbE family N-acetylglucosaminyl deacetylase